MELRLCLDFQADRSVARPALDCEFLLQGKTPATPKAASLSMKHVTKVKNPI